MSKQKTVNKASVSVDRPFKDPSLKRLCNLAGSKRNRLEAIHTLNEVAQKITESVLLQCLCSLTASRSENTLQKSHIQSACNALGIKLLVSDSKFSRLEVKKKAPKAEGDADTKTRKFRTSVSTKNTVHHYQKRSDGKLVGSSNNFRIYVRKTADDLYKNFPKKANAKGDLRFSKDFKVLFQVAVESILVMIISDAVVVSALQNRMSMRSVDIRFAANNHLFTNLNLDINLDINQE